MKQRPLEDSELQSLLFTLQVIEVAWETASLGQHKGLFSESGSSELVCSRRFSSNKLFRWKKLYCEPIEALNKGPIEWVKRNNEFSQSLGVLFCVRVFWCILSGTLQPHEGVIAQISTAEIYFFCKNCNKGNKSDFVIKISLNWCACLTHLLFSFARFRYFGFN